MQGRKLTWCSNENPLLKCDGDWYPQKTQSFLTLKKALKLNVILLQETKITEGKDIVIKNILWREAKHAAIHAMGKSEGLMCLWDKKILKGRVIVSSQKICSILFTFLDNKEKVVVINVYAPTTMARRKIMWASLNQTQETFKGLCWIVAGDFNVSLYPSEKRGGVEGFSNGMKDFVHNNELMDV